MSDLRETPIQRVLHRESLLLGGERELVLITLIVLVGSAISAKNIPSIAVSVLLWVVLIFLFRMMAKRDVYMSKVYLRQSRYQSFYPARSTAFACDA